MEVRYLLVRCRVGVVDYKMDSRWVPELLHTHLAEDLDCQRAGTVLGHCKVRSENRNVSWMVDLLASLSPKTDNLLGKSQ